MDESGCASSLRTTERRLTVTGLCDQENKRIKRIGLHIVALCPLFTFTLFTMVTKTTTDGKARYSFPKKEELAEATKEYAPYIQEARKRLEEYGIGSQCSVYNMQLVFSQVAGRFPEHLQDCIPYMTVRTFNGWKEEGRKVIKGQKAMQTVTWISAMTEDGEEETGRCYPKTTHVFGIWQTEPKE